MMKLSPWNPHNTGKLQLRRSHTSNLQVKVTTHQRNSRERQLAVILCCRHICTNNGNEMQPGLDLSLILVLCFSLFVEPHQWRSAVNGFIATLAQLHSPWTRVSCCRARLRFKATQLPSSTCTCLCCHYF